MNQIKMVVSATSDTSVRLVQTLDENAKTPDDYSAAELVLCFDETFTGTPLVLGQLVTVNVEPRS